MIIIKALIDKHYTTVDMVIHRSIDYCFARNCQIHSVADNDKVDAIPI